MVYKHLKRKGFSPTKAPCSEDNDQRHFNLGSYWLTQKVGDSMKVELEKVELEKVELGKVELQKVSHFVNLAISELEFDKPKKSSFLTSNQNQNKLLFYDTTQQLHAAVIALTELNKNQADLSQEPDSEDLFNFSELETTNMMSSRRDMSTADQETDESISEDPFEAENEFDQNLGSQQEAVKSQKPRGRPPSSKTKSKLSKSSKPSKGSQKSSNRSQTSKKTGGPCYFCKTTESTYWRNRGPNKMCNPCGIRLKKYSVWCSQCHYVPNKEEFKGLCSSCNIKYKPFKD